jgi:hypothetical protein
MPAGLVLSPCDPTSLDGNTDRACRWPDKEVVAAAGIDDADLVADAVHDPLVGDIERPGGIVGDGCRGEEPSAGDGVAFDHPASIGPPDEDSEGTTRESQCSNDPGGRDDHDRVPSACVDHPDRPISNRADGHAPLPGSPGRGECEPTRPCREDGRRTRQADTIDHSSYHPSPRDRPGACRLTVISRRIADPRVSKQAAVASYAGQRGAARLRDFYELSHDGMARGERRRIQRGAEANATADRGSRPECASTVNDDPA